MWTNTSFVEPLRILLLNKFIKPIENEFDSNDHKYKGGYMYMYIYI